MNAMVAKFEFHNKLIIMMNGENQTHTMPLYMTFSENGFLNIGNKNTNKSLTISDKSCCPVSYSSN